MSKWKNKLKKSQLIHLMDHGITELDEFIIMRNRQLEMKKEDEISFSSLSTEPCWECSDIARRLNICQEAN